MSFSLFHRKAELCRLAVELENKLEKIAELEAENKSLKAKINKQTSTFQQKLNALEKENKDLRGKNECQQRKFEEIKAVLHVN